MPLFAATVLVLTLSNTPLHAQQRSDLSPQQLQELLKNASPEQLEQLRARGVSLPTGNAPASGPVQPNASGSSRNTPSAAPAQPILLTPSEPRSGRAAGSTLEDVLSQHAGHSLQQFGYDQVGIGASVSVPQTGTIQDDYILGQGDEINVVLRGQENSQFTAAVDRNGQVVLPKTGPVLAAGKALGAFRQELLAAIGHAYVSTQAYVSMGQLRQVTVMVAGEVNNPGMRIATGLSNPLDVILLSGGIRKSGSLRDIKLIRHGTTTTIDLYGVLAKRGSAKLENLQDGDRVFVPPIGATVAVAGYVRRPAIYELAAGQRSVGAQELLSLANGPVLRGRYTLSLERILADGRGQFVDISGQPGTAVRDGEILILKSDVNISVGRVTLSGAVRTPGSFAVSKYKTLHDLLPSKDALEPGAYVLFGFIDRINPNTLQHEALPFSPLHVIASAEDIPLITYDAVHILTFESMKTLLRPPSGGSSSDRESADTIPAGLAVSATVSPDQANASSAPSVIGAAGTSPTAGGQPSGPNETGQGASGRDGADVAGAEADISTSAKDLGAAFGNKLTDYQIGFSGAVHKPGTYLVAPNTPLSELINVLGGLAQDVDLNRFELTSTVIDNASGKSTTLRKEYPATKQLLSGLMLQPYDRVAFHHVYSDRDTGDVSVEGQVRYPGSYNILRGEHLSSVLLRAGGLTEVAYPDGTIFLRESVARQQSEEYRKAAIDIRSQLFAVLMRPTAANSQAPSAETIVALQSLLSQIEKQPALGRISIIADPVELAVHPEQDPLLEGGDHIVIPKRPSTIAVLGEVMRPGAFRVDSSMSVDDYVEQAGGFSEFSDSGHIIIVLPDGRSRISRSSFWHLGVGEELPPGTTIVVPRNVTGIDFHQFVVDTVQIVSQLATTAAALAVLTTNIH